MIIIIIIITMERNEVNQVDKTIDLSVIQNKTQLLVEDAIKRGQKACKEANQMYV